MKILGFAAKWGFILCLPVLLLTASIAWAVNSPWLYHYGFQKYEVSLTTGLTDSELGKVAPGLIAYFNSSEEYLDLTVLKDNQPFVLFNQREIAHLKDVKGLVRLDYRLLLGTLIYTLGYAIGNLLKDWRRLAWTVVGGSSLTLALVVALGLATLLGFDQLFYQFHLLSFANDFWQLDPTKDYLIRLFPQGFWYDATLFCTLATTVGALILDGMAGGYLLKLKVSLF